MTNLKDPLHYDDDVVDYLEMLHSKNSWDLASNCFGLIAEQLVATTTIHRMEYQRTSWQGFNMQPAGESANVSM